MSCTYQVNYIQTSIELFHGTVKHQFYSNSEQGTVNYQNANGSSSTAKPGESSPKNGRSSSKYSKFDNSSKNMWIKQLR